MEHGDIEIAANLDNICNNIRLCLQLTHVLLMVQAQMVHHCHASFDDWLVRLYTKRVYLEYRQRFDKSMAFQIDLNQGVPNGFLVKQQRGWRFMLV